jgi:acetoin utilization protein AcuB
MRVGKIMIKDPITVPVDISVHTAIKLLQNHNIRHLPVLEDDKLVGWLSSRDLYQVMLAAMIEKITVGDIMNRSPLTVTPDTDIVEAAHLMRNHKIGGVPVINDSGRLVGVLTVIDLLSSFLYMLGALQSSSRLELVLDEDPASFDEVCQIIQQSGDKIINVALGAPAKGKRTYSFRLSKCDLKPIVDRLTKHGVMIQDILE